MKSSVWKATAIIFAFTLVSKVLAFFKTILQASVFGASMETDAFNMASGFVANILMLLTAAIGVAFIPLYVQHRTKSREEGRRFASMTFTVLSLITLVVTAVVIVCAPAIIGIIAPTYGGEERELTIIYFRVIALGLVFNLGYELFINLLNAEKIYGFSAFGSMINSVVIAAAILFLGARYGVWILVVTVPLSYLIQWLVLYLRGRGFGTYTLRYGLRDHDLSVLAVQALPIMLSQAAVDINQVVDRALLSFIGTGVVTAVSYSVVLQRSCCALISLPVSTVMFTELAEAGAANDETRICGILKSGYKLLVFVCIPIMIVVFLTADDIVSIIYGHGSFDSEAVTRCAIGLRMYILCLLPVCVKDLLDRAYYSVNQTRRAMIFGVFEVALNISLSVALVRRFAIYGVVGATAIASLAALIVMLIDYNRHFIGIITHSTVRDYRQILPGALVTLAAALILHGRYIYNDLVDLAVKTIAVFGVYGVMMLALREPLALMTVDSIRGYIRRRF